MKQLGFMIRYVVSVFLYFLNNSLNFSWLKWLLIFISLQDFLISRQVKISKFYYEYKMKVFFSNLIIALVDLMGVNKLV